MSETSDRSQRIKDAEAAIRVLERFESELRSMSQKDDRWRIRRLLLDNAEALNAARMRLAITRAEQDGTY